MKVLGSSIALLCVLQAQAQTQTWFRSMQHLPDTGQEESFTSTPGEDSDVSIYPLSYSVHGDGTLTDEVTGLIWQVEDGGEMTIESAIIYCDTLQLAGYSDWRLPSAHELMSIQDLQASNPSIDTQSFASTEAEYWWSADAQANDANKIWVTNAGGGIGNHPKSETISACGTHRFHVRAVRYANPPLAIQSRFISHGDGTVTDALTDLMWQQAISADSLSWEDALHYADTIVLGGHTDWRLPNIKELHSINQEDLINPSIDVAWTGINQARKWWSSTTLLNDPLKAWYLYSRFGITTYDAKAMLHHVILVRGDELQSNVDDDFRRDMLFYPNPVSSVLFSTQQQMANLKIYDARGSYVGTFTGCGHWDLSVLFPGSYFVYTSQDTKPFLLIVEE